MTDPVVVDARGYLCPTPSLKLMKAMRDVAPGTCLILLATDPMARIDVPFLMSQKNGRMIATDQDGDVIRLTVEAGPNPED